MNSLIIAFFVTTGSTGPSPVPRPEPSLAGGAYVRSTIAEAEEGLDPVDMMLPAIRTIEFGKARFEPETATPFIA